MGKVVDSFWVALEDEINRWSGFERALRKPDREAFDELICAFRSYASECSIANNPIVFESMVMSILLDRQKRILTLEKELNIIQQEVSIPEPEQAQEN
jgi:hypothetical protein